MINKIFLSEMKLKKKIINDDKNFSEAEKNNYLINKEKKLTQSYYFNYHKIAQIAAKKITMKKVRKIVRETDQKRFRVSKQRFARTLNSKER